MTGLHNYLRALVFVGLHIKRNGCRHYPDGCTLPCRIPAIMVRGRFAYSPRRTWTFTSAVLGVIWMTRPTTTPRAVALYSP